MDQALNEVISSIYDAAIDPSLWPDTLDKCAWFAGARSCAIFDFSPSNTALPLTLSHMCGSFPATALENYNQDNLKQEVSDRLLAQGHISRADTIEALSDEVVYSDYNEFLGRANVKSLSKIGLRHRVIAFLNKDNLNTGHFTLQYADGRGPATPDELTRLNCILPHVAKAVDLGRPAHQLAFEHQGLLTAMDRLTIGVGILNTKGQLILSNTEFQRQTDSHKALFSTSGGTLRFNDASDQRLFEILKLHAQNHGRFGGRPRKEAIATNHNSFLCLEVLPVTRSQEMGTQPFAGYVLFSTDTGLPRPYNTSAIQAAYGLTDTESTIINAISDGLTNAQIAELRERSVTTINAQVKSILAKTQCSNRTQFVRLMMSFGTDHIA